MSHSPWLNKVVNFTCCNRSRFSHSTLSMVWWPVPGVSWWQNIAPSRIPDKSLDLPIKQDETRQAEYGLSIRPFKHVQANEQIGHWSDISPACRHPKARLMDVMASAQVELNMVCVSPCVTLPELQKYPIHPTCSAPHSTTEGRLALSFRARSRAEALKLFKRF